MIRNDCMYLLELLPISFVELLGPLVFGLLKQRYIQCVEQMYALHSFQAKHDLIKPPSLLIIVIFMDASHFQ